MNGILYGRFRVLTLKPKRGCGGGDCMVVRFYKILL